MKNNWLLKKVALEIVKADFQGQFQILRSFDFLRQEHEIGATMLLNHVSALVRGRGHPVDLQHVGQRDHNAAGIVGEKVIESQAVANRLEPNAGFHHFLVGRDGLQNLEHDALLREQRHVIVHKCLAGAVEEPNPMIAEKIETHQKRAIQRAAAGDVGILPRAKAVFPAIAKEQLVSEYFRRAVENRLTGNERRPARPFTPSFDLGGAVVSLTECTSVVWQKAVQLRKYVFRKTPPKTFTGAKSVIKVTQIVNARVSSPSEPPYLICLCTFVLSEAGDRGGRTVYLRYH